MLTCWQSNPTRIKRRATAVRNKGIGNDSSTVDGWHDLQGLRALAPKQHCVRVCVCGGGGGGGGGGGCVRSCVLVCL